MPVASNGEKKRSVEKISASELKKLKKDGQRFVKQAHKLLKKHSKKVNPSLKKKVEVSIAEAEKALEGDDGESLTAALHNLDESLEKNLGRYRKSTLREYAEAIGLAIAFAFLLRAFLVEAFIIPSASMEPTLQEGDRLFVNKFVYGVRLPLTTTRVIDFGAPDRGDVVVFVFPREEAAAHTKDLPPHRRGCVDKASLVEEKDYIKRVVGLPTDRIKMINNVVHINGKPVPSHPVKQDPSKKKAYEFQNQQSETLGEHDFVSQNYGNDANFGLTEEVTVKEGHVFVMGDNRDNSSDSRCWGQVPIENIKGKAMFIWLSSDGDGIHWERIGQMIE